MTGFSILGAGVAGLAVGSALLARGAKVQIFDPKGPPGAHGCSWWAGGMLAPWCEYETAEAPVLRLGRAAFDWWNARTKVARCGTLVLARGRDLPDLKRFARRTEGYETLGIDGIRALEPDLPDFSQGLYFAKEAHLNPRQALTDLYTQLRAQGALFHFETAPKTAKNIIDCRGIAACDRLSDLRAVRGEMLVIRCHDVALSRPVRLLHPRIPLYIVPRGDGVYMIGATVIESSDRRNITARSMLDLLSAAYTLNPAFGEAEILESGSDLRPAFLNNLPAIRRLDGVIYANGLYRHGYLLAPALAEAVADLALENKESELVDANYP